MGAPLHIHETCEPGCVRLVLVGELDLAGAPLLRERLTHLRPQQLVLRLDLSKLEFIDNTGLQVLVQAVHDAAGHLEFELELAPQVRRLLELTHTDRLIVPAARASG